MRATIPSSLMFSWQSQAVQYRRKGKPGISYIRGTLPDTDEIVDCLLYRNEKGHLVGILNHYTRDGEWEKKGNVNIWVRRDCQRRGIGTALLTEACKRWLILFEQQRYTVEGTKLVAGFRAI